MGSAKTTAEPQGSENMLFLVNGNQTLHYAALPAGNHFLPLTLRGNEGQRFRPEFWFQQPLNTAGGTIPE